MNIVTHVCVVNGSFVVVITNSNADPTFTIFLNVPMIVSPFDCNDWLLKVVSKPQVIGCFSAILDCSLRCFWEVQRMNPFTTTPVTLTVLPNLSTRCSGASVTLARLACNLILVSRRFTAPVCLLCSTDSYTRKVLC